MKPIESDEYWNDILEKFSNHTGTIASFCKNHNVNTHRLYHRRRKKILDMPLTTFHAIELNENATSKENSLENNHKPSTEIRIEMGKAKIYLSNTDNVSLATILKEITRNC